MVSPKDIIHLSIKWRNVFSLISDSDLSSLLSGKKYILRDIFSPGLSGTTTSDFGYCVQCYDTIIFKLKHDVKRPTEHTAVFKPNYLVIDVFELD